MNDLFCFCCPCKWVVCIPQTRLSSHSSVVVLLSLPADGCLKASCSILWCFYGNFASTEYSVLDKLLKRNGWHKSQIETVSKCRHCKLIKRLLLELNTSATTNCKHIQLDEFILHFYCKASVHVAWNKHPEIDFSGVKCDFTVMYMHQSNNHPLLFTFFFFIPQIYF